MAAAPEAEKMLPRITDDTRPFWDALRERRFITTKCADCGRVAFPPRLLSSAWSAMSPSCWTLVIRAFYVQ